MRTTPNLGLKVWNLANDEFNPQDLADNWDALDSDFTRPRSANQAEILITLPVVGNFDGRLVYLSAANGGFAANTLVRYASGSWKAVGPFEVFNSVPVTGNFAGRMILLSASSGGFNAWSLIRYDGSAWGQVNNGVDLSATVPVTGNFAGRLVLLTAPDGGFEAYSLIAYNGTTYARVEKRGVENGTTLPGSPYAGQVFVPTVAVSGFQAYDVGLYNGSAWRQVSSPPLVSAGTLAGMSSMPDGYEVYLIGDAANGVNWHLRYNAGSASSLKWEFVGGPSVVATIDVSQSTSTTTYTDLGTVGPSVTVPRTGDYDVEIYALILANDVSYISPSGAGITAADSEAAIGCNLGFLGAADYNVLYRKKRYANLTGGATIKMMYKAGTANPRSFDHRRLSITPVRL